MIYASGIVIIPNKAISIIYNLIQNFICDSTTSQIYQKTLIQQIDNGGLK